MDREMKVTKVKRLQYPGPTADGGTDFMVRCPKCREVVKYHAVANGPIFAHCKVAPRRAP